MTDRNAVNGRNMRKPAMRHFKSFVIAIAAMLGMAAPAAAQLRVTVVGEEYVPMRIAVPDFDSSGTSAPRRPIRSLMGRSRRTG